MVVVVIAVVVVVVIITLLCCSSTTTCMNLLMNLLMNLFMSLYVQIRLDLLTMSLKAQLMKTLILMIRFKSLRTRSRHKIWRMKKLRYLQKTPKVFKKMTEMKELKDSKAMALLEQSSIFMCVIFVQHIFLLKHLQFLI